MSYDTQASQTAAPTEVEEPSPPQLEQATTRASEDVQSEMGIDTLRSFVKRTHAKLETQPSETSTVFQGKKQLIARVDEFLKIKVDDARAHTQLPWEVGKPLSLLVYAEAGRQLWDVLANPKEGMEEGARALLRRMREEMGIRMQ